MSLLAAEGYETAQSKARRGASPLPLERFFRDARGLRISGGVDFQLDNWAGRLYVFSYYYPAPDNAAEIESAEPDLAGLEDASLSPRNLAHLRFVATEVRTFARRCLELSRRHPDPERLLAKERLCIVASEIANELTTMSLFLARTSTLADNGCSEAQALADVYCTAARNRLEGLWRQVAADDEPNHAAISEGWLRASTMDFMLRDVFADLPSAALTGVAT
jgi:hypothetical protein